MARDCAESMRVAIDRWESLKGEELKGAEDLRERLFELDERFRKRARFLVGLNRRRRLERDLLDEAARETAWWFALRADCDDLLRLLAGTATATSEQHLAGCSLCRDDLKRSRLVERPPERHLTSEDLWNLDLGLLPAEERRELKRHAESCKACGQLMHAMEEGEKAIEGSWRRAIRRGARGAPRRSPSGRAGRWRWSGASSGYWWCGTAGGCGWWWSRGRRAGSRRRSARCRRSGRRCRPRAPGTGWSSTSARRRSFRGRTAKVTLRIPSAGTPSRPRSRCRGSVVRAASSRRALLHPAAHSAALGQ